MTGYLVYDVFTSTPFGGNQLAVIPDATSLNEADLQRITTEFNFSEAAFVYPPKDPANSARVRIFTRAGEIPFAGHPTIGTAIALSDLGVGDDMILELGCGPIPCEVANGTPKSAAFTTTAVLEQYDTVPAEVVTDCLAIPKDAIVTDSHAPQAASIGRSFVMIELANPDVLSQATPVLDAFQNARAQYGGPENRFSTYLYTKTQKGVQARMFSPLTGTVEDPATGGAAATLGAYLSALHAHPQTLEISQGIEMGRPSKISVSTILKDDKLSSVTVRGSAVKTMQGRFVF